MARTLNDIYILFDNIIRKERGVFITPAQKDLYFNAAQLDLVEDYWKIYAEEEYIHEALDVFKTDYQFTSAADGRVTLPTNYLHLCPNVITVTGSMINPVRFVGEDEWTKASISQLRAVSTANPIARTYGNGFKLLPQTTQIGTLTYIRIPNVPVFGYSVGGSANRTITYNSSTSTQLEWDDVYINKIISKALEYAGVYMSEPEVTAYGMAKDKEQ
jgi:hypothetical protein